MTDETVVDAFTQFDVIDKPENIDKFSNRGKYKNLLKALENLRGDKAISMTSRKAHELFGSKSIRSLDYSLRVAGRRLNLKTKVVEKDGQYYFFTRDTKK